MYFSLPVVSASAFLIFVVGVEAKTTELSVRQLVQRAKEQCVKETNATPEQTKIVFNHAETPKDDGEKCFLECMYKEMGVVKDGKYNVEGALRFIDLKYKGEEVVLGKKLISDCAPKVVAKDGEKCYLGRAIRECVLEGSKEINFFPGA